MIYCNIYIICIHSPTIRRAHGKTGHHTLRAMRRPLHVWRGAPSCQSRKHSMTTGACWWRRTVPPSCDTRACRVSLSRGRCVSPMLPSSCDRRGNAPLWFRSDAPAAGVLLPAAPTLARAVAPYLSSGRGNTPRRALVTKCAVNVFFFCLYHTDARRAPSSSRMRCCVSRLFNLMPNV